MQQAIIAIGSNLGQRQLTVARAIMAVQERVGTVLRRSRVIETEPLLLPGSAPGMQPAYLNAVIALETAEAPEAIMRALLEIEKSLGRDRSLESRKWMSRIIDLDLIAVDDHVLDTEILKLPHPEMHKRSFVLEPMLEVAPNWRHPLLGRTVRDLWLEIGAARPDNEGITRA